MGYAAELGGCGDQLCRECGGLEWCETIAERELGLRTILAIQDENRGLPKSRGLTILHHHQRGLARLKGRTRW